MAEYHPWPALPVLIQGPIQAMPVFRGCGFVFLRKERASGRFRLQELAAPVSSRRPEGAYQIVFSSPEMTFRCPEIQRPPVILPRFKNRIAFRPPYKIVALPHIHSPSSLSRPFKTVVKKILFLFFPGYYTYIPGVQILYMNFFSHMRLLPLPAQPLLRLTTIPYLPGYLNCTFKFFPKASATFAKKSRLGL